MAGDRSQYNQAFRKWEQLQDEQCFSVPQDEGVVAILVSGYPYHLSMNIEHGPYEPYGESLAKDFRDEIEFKNEAQEISTAIGMLGVVSEIIPNADIDKVATVLEDKTVTDIVFIGHGSLNDIFLEGAKNDRLDWFEAAQLTTHLKLGAITQRQCGVLPRRINVPLGTFLVSDIGRIRAAYGKEFKPKGIAGGQNVNVRRVYNVEVPPSYRELRKETR